MGFAIAGHFPHDHDLLESLTGIAVFLAGLSKNSQLLLVGLVNGLQEEGQEVVFLVRRIHLGKTANFG